MTVRVSIPLSDVQKARLDQIAEARQETTADVIAEAVSHYLDYDAWFVAEVQKGLASIDRGDTVEFDEAARKLRARMDARVRESER